MTLIGLRCSMLLFALVCHRAFSETPLGSSSSPGSINPQSAPPPKAGESPEQWINSLFAPTALVSDQDELDSQQNITNAVDEPQLTKRKSVRNNGFITSSWTNKTENASYEIRLDVSGCKTGVNLTTDIGVYTFTDGHTTNSTSFKDMIDDIYTLHKSTIDHRTRRFQIVNTKYANHTLALAKLAIKEANEALLVLLCRNATAATVTAPGYDFSQAPLLSQSLQKLGKRQAPNSYWLAALAASVLGGFVCAGIIGLVSKAVNETITTYNLVSVGLVVAFSTLVAASFNRCQQVGRLDGPANRIEGAANAAVGGAAAVLPNPIQVLGVVAPGGQEAVAQNAFIAWFRRNLQRIVTGAVREAVDEAISEITSNTFGTPVGTDSDHYQSANGDTESCLSVEDATRASEELQNLFSPDLELEPLQQLEDSVNEERPTGRGSQCVMQ